MSNIYPFELKEKIELAKATVETTGFHQIDKRLGRKTMSLVGYALSIDDGNILRWLKSEKPAPKFKEDWERIQETFAWCVEQFQLDPDSRRLLMRNDTGYYDVFQCFTQLQLLRDGESYTLVVNQRSGDVANMKDDLVFFGSVAHKFELKLKIKVREILVLYNHIHTQV